jgi:cardiolipin synthase
VIDGVIGYTGGVNIADEYANIKERFGHWKDGGIRLFGDGAEGLLRLFLSTWDFTVGENTDYRSAFLDRDKKDEGDGGLYIPFGSGPSPVYSQKVGKNLLLNIINQATKYVYVTTPYLIMDHELTEALCKAVARGVKVKIVTPGIADKRLVKVMTKSSYPYLIKHGVEIYEYLPGFIHEKTMISDDKYLISGTINLDYRSLMHHFEDGVFVIDSPVIDNALSAFNRTVEKSDFRDQNEARLTLIEWTFRNLVKIFAPIL